MTIRPADPGFLKACSSAWSSGDENRLRTVFAEEGVFIGGYGPALPTADCRSAIG